MECIMLQTLQLDSNIEARLTNQIKNVLRNIDIPDTNDTEVQGLLLDLALGKIIRSIGETMVKPAERALKTEYASKLTDQSSRTVLDTSSNMTLTAKVTKPRQTFNKDEFIKQVAEQYALSISELQTLAGSTVKNSSAPVSLNVEFN